MLQGVSLQLLWYTAFKIQVLYKIFALRLHEVYSFPTVTTFLKIVIKAIPFFQLLQAQLCITKFQG